MNIKRENLADATDANVAMSAPPRAYKLIVEVFNAHLIMTVDLMIMLLLNSFLKNIAAH